MTALSRQTPPLVHAVSIYLDYNAGGPLRAQVWEAMTIFANEHLGNPSSIHWAGRTARAALEEARAEVVALIGATSAELVFTSGGTEANNLAIRGVVGARRGGHIVTTAIEHASVRESCEGLLAEGCQVSYVGVDSAGRVDPAAVVKALRDETDLVTIGIANNEVGTIQPIPDIAREARRRNLPLHVDAVQAIGKIPVDVRALGADLLSMSAHKLGGPQGVGALYVRDGIALKRQVWGGPQERDRRGGTENVVGAVGFGMAARLARQELAYEALRQASLIARLWDGIRAAVPDVRRNTPTDDIVPNTLNVSFPDTDADALVIGLDLCGIAASAGSACAAGSLEPSHVLLAMGRSPEEARSALRISIGVGTTEADIDHCIAALPGVIERSRCAVSAEGRS